MFERYQNTSTEGLNQQKICGRAALGGLSTVKQFAVLTRDFFARLSRRQLSYFLSRELSQHVGVNSRFQTIRDGVKATLMALFCRVEIRSDRVEIAHRTRDDPLGSGQGRRRFGNILRRRGGNSRLLRSRPRQGG